LRKIKLRIFAALSYIPFGIALLFFSTNIVIRAILLFSVIPSIIVGVKSSKKNDKWEHLHFILDSCLQPWMRIEFSLIGILSTLQMDTETWLLFLAIAIFLIPIAVWSMKVWIFADIRAEFEEN